MKIVRMFTGEDNQSHFEDVQIDLHPISTGFLSEAFAVTELQFGTIENIEINPWHTMEKPLYVIVTHGKMEVELGDGTKKTFHPGDVLLAEDTTGYGHITRINYEKCCYITAALKS